jgi:uncharacterized protein
MTDKKWAAPLEIKELGANGFVSGYASVFGSVDAQREVVQAGAFTRSLSAWKRTQRQPAMLWMHDTGKPVGVWEKVREDASGLAVEGRLAIRTQDGADAYELLRMGAVTGLSIGYRTVASRIDAKNRVRTLTDVDLYEISLVTFPANDAARIHAVKTPFVPGGDWRVLAERLRRVAEMYRE